MTEALVPAIETSAIDAAAEAMSGVAPASSAAIALPRLIVDAAPAAVGRFLEFFAGRIANERTRAAYGRATAVSWAELTAVVSGKTSVVTEVRRDAQRALQI